MESGMKEKHFYHLETVKVLGSANPNLRQEEGLQDNSDQPDLEKQEMTICSGHVKKSRSPEFIQLRVLPLVMMLEIFQTLLTTGSVSVFILLLRYASPETVIMRIAVLSLCHTIMLFTVVHFARKWRKLVPVISVTCYSCVIVHFMYIADKFIETM